MRSWRVKEGIAVAAAVCVPCVAVATYKPPPRPFVKWIIDVGDGDATYAEVQFGLDRIGFADTPDKKVYLSTDREQMLWRATFDGHIVALAGKASSARWASLGAQAFSKSKHVICARQTTGMETPLPVLCDADVQGDTAPAFWSHSLLSGDGKVVAVWVLETAFRSEYLHDRARNFGTRVGASAVVVIQLTPGTKNAGPQVRHALSRLPFKYDTYALMTNGAGPLAAYSAARALYTIPESLRAHSIAVYDEYLDEPLVTAPVRLHE